MNRNRRTILSSGYVSCIRTTTRFTSCQHASRSLRGTTADSMSGSPYSTSQLGRFTFRERRRVRCGPPSGFDYPLGGLHPAEPGRPCFMPTALLGLCPSKHSPLNGWLPCFHRGRTHVPFIPCLLHLRLFSTRVQSQSWPATRAAVPGCPSAESPWRHYPS